jgi:hypothetical protein
LQEKEDRSVFDISNSLNDFEFEKEKDGVNRSKMEDQSSSNFRSILFPLKVSTDGTSLGKCAEISSKVKPIEPKED